MSVASAKLLFADSDAYRADTRDDGVSPYLLERKRFYTEDKWNALLDQLAQSCTIYVGNLSFYTTEEQLLELFTRVGPVRRLIMGLNALDKTPCGFAFVIFETHAAALSAQRFISATSVDERVIRADLDPGFEEGRQFGRSKKSGGQRRDDYRADYDPGRGGFVSRQLEGTASARNNPEQATDLLSRLLSLLPCRLHRCIRMCFLSRVQQLRMPS